jgi:hypothetical protein
MLTLLDHLLLPRDVGLAFAVRLARDAYAPGPSF